MKIAILCIGNRLMLDDGVGPAVYDALEAGYRFGDDVALYDAGCMTMDLLPHVCKADFVIVVDAVDGTGEQPGTVFRFAPGDIAGHGVMQSLHDMRLSDLLASASLLGHDADGVCFGIQVENMSPASFIEGLTPRVHAALPLLVDCSPSLCAWACNSITPTALPLCRLRQATPSALMLSRQSSPRSLPISDFRPVRNRL